MFMGYSWDMISGFNPFFSNPATLSKGLSKLPFGYHWDPYVAHRFPLMFTGPGGLLWPWVNFCCSSLIGGWPTPLKNMKVYEFVTWDDEIPKIWKVIKFHGSSHHQSWPCQKPGKNPRVIGDDILRKKDHPPQTSNNDCPVGGVQHLTLSRCLFGIFGCLTLILDIHRHFQTLTFSSFRMDLHHFFPVNCRKTVGICPIWIYPWSRNNVSVSIKRICCHLQKRSNCDLPPCY